MKVYHIDSFNKVEGKRINDKDMLTAKDIGVAVKLLEWDTNKILRVKAIVEVENPIVSTDPLDYKSKRKE